MIPIQDVVPTGRTPWATLLLILVTVVVFSLTDIVPATQDAWLWAPFAHSAWPQLVVGGIFLWLFGDNVEARLGRATFLAVFIVAGMAAAFATARLGHDASGIGAAGAVTGVLGAYLVLLPSSRVLMFTPVPPSLVEVPAGFFIALWGLLQLVEFVLVPAAVSHTLSMNPLWGLALSFTLGAATARVIRRRVDWLN